MIDPDQVIVLLGDLKGTKEEKQRELKQILGVSQLNKSSCSALWDSMVRWVTNREAAEAVFELARRQAESHPRLAEVLMAAARGEPIDHRKNDPVIIRDLFFDNGGPRKIAKLLIEYLAAQAGQEDPSRASEEVGHAHAYHGEADVDDREAVESPRRRSRSEAPLQARGSIASGHLVSNRWKIGCLLGRGGFGEVYEVRDQQNPRRAVLALKFLNGQLTVEREREFEIADRLRHDNVCRYFDLGFDDSSMRSFLVMEHGGSSLAQLIEEEPNLSWKRIVGITGQVASALDYLHSREVIHGDVSPSNVLVSGSDAVKVTDFGASLRSEQLPAAHGVTLASRTVKAHHLVYSAPEVLRTGRATRRSDQFSLALVVCSMLEGRGLEPDYEPRSFSRLSRSQNQSLMKALESRPGDRFDSCLGFVESLCNGR